MCSAAATLSVEQARSNPLARTRFDIDIPLITSCRHHTPSSNSVAPVHQLPAEIRLLHADVPDLIYRARQDVAIQNDKVRQLAFFERALLFFLESQIGIVCGVQADS